jgi:hypothetical protein
MPACVFPMQTDHLHHSRLKIRDADWLARVKPRSDSPAKAIKASIRPWPDAVPLNIMSTKNSLAYSHDNSFHLYTECFDSGKSVWLELNKCAFEASDRGIKLEIPIAVWEVIRQQTPARFDLSGLTNAQIKAKAESRVADQRAKYLAASKVTKNAPCGSACAVVMRIYPRKITWPTCSQNYVSHAHRNGSFFGKSPSILLSHSPRRRSPRFSANPKSKYLTDLPTSAGWPNYCTSLIFTVTKPGLLWLPEKPRPRYTPWPFPVIWWTPIPIKVPMC